MDATLVSCIGSNLAEVFNSLLAARPGRPALQVHLSTSSMPTDRYGHRVFVQTRMDPRSYTDPDMRTIHGIGPYFRRKLPKRNCP